MALQVEKRGITNWKYTVHYINFMQSILQYIDKVLTQKVIIEILILQYKNQIRFGNLTAQYPKSSQILIFKI